MKLRRSEWAQLGVSTKKGMSLVEGRLWSRLLMPPRPTVSDARHYIRTCLQAALIRSFGASFACMELTIISRFQRLQTSRKYSLHSLFYSFSVLSILRVLVKWLTFNMVSQLWADVKYLVPTRFGFSPKASGFYPFGDATDLIRGRRWWCGVADSSSSLKSDMSQH